MVQRAYYQTAKPKAIHAGNTTVAIFNHILDIFIFFVFREQHCAMVNRYLVPRKISRCMVDKKETGERKIPSLMISTQENVYL